MFLAAASAINTAVLRVSFVDLLRPPNVPPSVTLGRVGRSCPGQPNAALLSQPRVCPESSQELPSFAHSCRRSHARTQLPPPANHQPDWVWLWTDCWKQPCQYPPSRCSSWLILVLRLSNQSSNADPLTRASYFFTPASGFSFSFDEMKLHH